MKRMLAISFGVLLFSCDGDEDPLPDFTGIVLSSNIIEHSNGGFEYEVFCLEEGTLQRVNTKTNPLKPYSIGVMTYSNAQGEATGVAIASLTSDLEFVLLNDHVFEEINHFPDSLPRVTMAIDANQNDHIGIISKSRQFKLKVVTADFDVKENTPVSRVVFSGEYLK